MYTQTPTPPPSYPTASQGMAPSSQPVGQPHVSYHRDDYPMPGAVNTPPRHMWTGFQQPAVTASPLTAGIASMNLDSQVPALEVPQVSTGSVPMDTARMAELLRVLVQTPAGQLVLNQFQAQGQQASPAVCPSQPRDDGKHPDLK